MYCYRKWPHLIRRVYEMKAINIKYIRVVLWAITVILQFHWPIMCIACLLGRVCHVLSLLAYIDFVRSIACFSANCFSWIGFLLLLDASAHHDINNSLNNFTATDLSLPPVTSFIVIWDGEFVFVCVKTEFKFFLMILGLSAIELSYKIISLFQLFFQFNFCNAVTFAKFKLKCWYLLYIKWHLVIKLKTVSDCYLRYVRKRPHVTLQDSWYRLRHLPGQEPIWNENGIQRKRLKRRLVRQVN